MVKEITRRLVGRYIYANNTIIFGSNPYLLANNTLTLQFNSNDSYYAADVLSVSGNNAVVNFRNEQYANSVVNVVTDCFCAGVTGEQEVFNLSYGHPVNVLFQGVSDGGTSTLSIQGSLDKSHWVTLGSMGINVGVSNSNTVVVTSPWAYGRLNISSIGAGNTVRVYKSV